MIIKKLNEGDLHNFECISQYGFSKINKKLELDQVEHKKIIIQKHDSILTLFHDKKQTNKINKNIIKLVDLNIHTEYSPSLNEVQIKCETTYGELNLKLEKYSFNNRLEHKSVTLYDSGFSHVLNTGYIIDQITNTFPRTYTCLATNFLTKKILTKTKFLLSKSGESFIIRYLYTDYCHGPIRVFEFDVDHFENILFQINSGNIS